MIRPIIRNTAVAIAGILLLLAVTPAARAHERRTVGDYNFVVGFIVEPAFEGQKNGIDLRVTIGEADAAVPVEGVQETLQVEVTHVPSGISQVMDLRTIFRDPGHYTNDWIPSAPGQYRFRFFGTIDGAAVDETFESGPGTFGSVEPAAELYFPEPVPAARELEGAVRGAQDSADEALTTALNADNRVAAIQSLSVIAIVIAAIAGVVGGAAFMTARRQ